jgi:recombination associated protein RdgC
MPVLRGAVTFARFRAGRGGPPRADSRRWLVQGLRKKAFAPLDLQRAEEDRSTGFVELEQTDSTAFGPDLLQGEYALFAYRIDAVRVPAAAVRQELDRWAAAFEAEQGRPPAKRERAARREAVRQALRQRTPPISRVHDVSWNLKRGEVAIWAASRKAVDEVAAALEEALGVELHPLSPSAIAKLGGVPDDALAPTPALIGPGIGAREVDHGEA